MITLGHVRTESINTEFYLQCTAICVICLFIYLFITFIKFFKSRSVFDNYEAMMCMWALCCKGHLLCAVQSGHAGLPHPQAETHGNGGSVLLQPTTLAGYEQSSETPLPEKHREYMTFIFKIYTYSPSSFHV